MKMQHIARLTVAAFVVAIIGVAFAAAATAGDYGPPPGPGGATCRGYFIDPPVDAIVKSVVTIDGQTFSPASVVYDQEDTHRANFAWTVKEAALLDQPGEHSGSIVFSWNIGTGTKTIPFTLTCTETPPPTTVPPTTVPPTTAPPTTEATTTTTTVAPPVTEQTTPPTTPPTQSNGLPNTGGPHTLDYAVAAIVFVGAGLGLVASSRFGKARRVR